MNTLSVNKSAMLVVLSALISLFLACRPQSAQQQHCPKDMAKIPGLGACIDRYEASFASDLSAAKQGHATHKALSRADASPATSLNWHQAQSACQASHKRLCTMDEWQHACAGADKKRRYPYGDSYEAERCWDRPRSQKFSKQGPSKTGSAPDCVSPEGVYDLSGNVWEWIADRGPNGEPAFMLGSGSNNDSKSKLACDPGKHIGQPSDSKADGLGFRCCKTL